LSDKEADMSLANKKTVAGVDSKLAIMRLWTTHGNQQDSKLRQTPATVQRYSNARPV